MMKPASLLFVFLALSMTGCAAEAEDESSDAESTENAVIGGTTTFERPEIGMVWHGGLCTGTLIRPNVVITAMHCGAGTPVDADVSTASPGYVFEIRKSETERHRYPIVRANSIAQPADFDGSQRWRAKDILLLKLAEDVPASIAKPANVATTPPRVGSKTAVYGYGCTDRDAGADGRRPGTGTKRKRELWWTVWMALGADTSMVCPGDSGGPFLDVGRNAVFGTNSGYVGSDDKFGDVPAASKAINELADRWASEK